MEDVYKTIEIASEGLFKDKGSRFIGYAFPVFTEDEIKDHILRLKKEHYSARHHCYAWRLGADKERFRANDDGEPSSSAGKPILGQIHSFDLTNILIVVVRYFGGTLLGVSGLINAYRAAAKDAIENARIIEKTVEDIIMVEFGYESMNDVMKIFKDEQLPQLETSFDLNCRIKTSVRLSESQRICGLLKKTEGVVVRIL
ncbi:MAG: YigZ family protein [Bacteroidetes bacterium GWF2_42_66]|nr:MAG: YigZ family protein [Bacteroidetes bacterium GWA2_42_15]OFY01138.1 MAG: YigZ family protein [Bacteroidetes bacterium GWE2_42_39]OFY41981.1 MAG: YigZ family protein [Bacteroidetes bacterium GWF2_42_66]HBL77821.1 YigZ family protein [Prolixibacteraceae bacterium]HCR90537.1 YigZ family protein [Prolixibacteraceae bacterium]